MLATNDAELCDRVQILNNHGRVPGQQKQFWPEFVGYKYKMSNVQAAIGCAQMERAEELIAAKRRVFRTYAKGLQEFTHISLNPEPSGTLNGYWMPTAVFLQESGVTRERLLAAFAGENIDARQ